MASIEKIKTEIAPIAQQRKNTTAAEIKWVVDQLGMNDIQLGRATRRTACCTPWEARNLACDDLACAHTTEATNRLRSAASTTSLKQ
jgi:hypothetical protein